MADDVTVDAATPVPAHEATGAAETELELVHRNTRDSKAQVVHQQATVFLFRTAGLPVHLAEIELANFEAKQMEHAAQLSRLKVRYADIAMPHPPFPWKRLS